MEPKCNLIIDSCCDLPLHMVQREGVELLNFSYILDGQIYPDDFFQSTTPKAFYDAMREGASPTTSQVSPADLEAAFVRAAESGIPTVYLSMSSGISSNYESASNICSMVKERYPEAELYVVDTLIGCTPEGLMVLEAMRQRKLGLTAKEMVAWAEEARYFIHIGFMVDDLDALHRGGRLPAAVAVAGGALNVKPILSFATDGTLSLVGAARGRKKGLKHLAGIFEKLHDSTDRNVVLVGNADCPEEAERLAEKITDIDPSVTVIVHNIGMTIGSHVGANMISVAFWGTDRRKPMTVADRIARAVKGE